MGVAVPIPGCHIGNYFINFNLQTCICGSMTKRGRLCCSLLQYWKKTPTVLSMFPYLLVDYISLSMFFVVVDVGGCTSKGDCWLTKSWCLISLLGNPCVCFFLLAYFMNLISLPLLICQLSLLCTWNAALVSKSNACQPLLLLQLLLELAYEQKRWGKIFWEPSETDAVLQSSQC